MGNHKGTCVPRSIFICVYVQFYLVQQGFICQTAQRETYRGREPNVFLFLRWYRGLRIRVKTQSKYQSVKRGLNTLTACSVHAERQTKTAFSGLSSRLPIISYSCKLGITLLFAGDGAGHIFAYHSGGGGARCGTEIKKRTINQGKQTDGWNKQSAERTEGLRWKRKHRYRGPEAHTVPTLICI